MESEDNKLSTTALAKKLNIPVQQLFATLKDYGWIQRAGESWALTPKGEFEGGNYQTSRRFGRYIVWPERLDHHPLLAAHQPTGLGVREATEELALHCLQTRGFSPSRFWDLMLASGLDFEGLYVYVTWPHEVIDNPVIHRELTRQSDQIQPPVASDELAPDMFSAPSKESLACNGIDGHSLRTPLEARICNWLYLAQLAHAYQRALPIEELIYADFYIPEGNVYIDCWEVDIPAGELSGKLHKREMYRELGLRSLEVNAADVDQLDEVLGRGLLAFGIRC
jgi:hypothetical protein